MSVPLIAVCAVVLSACSGNSAASSGAGSSAGAAPSSSGSSAASARAAGGLSGTVASIGSGTFSVAPASGGPRTVVYTADTSFTKVSDAALSDVAVGSCVVVTAAPGSDLSTGTVDATSVRISPQANGACGPTAPGAGGQPGAAGSGPGGFGGFGRRAGGSRGGSAARGSGSAAARAVVFGKVDSTSANSFVVDVVASRTGSASGATTTTAVDVSTTTTYSITAPATAGDLKVGECARVSSGGRPGARASASASPSRSASAPSGPVTATAVTLSQPVNGRCASGFGRSPGSPAPGSASGSA